MSRSAAGPRRAKPECEGFDPVPASEFLMAVWEWKRQQVEQGGEDALDGVVRDRAVDGDHPAVAGRRLSGRETAKD